jgi:thiol-disulfide isomerase/thioredoxin
MNGGRVALAVLLAAGISIGTAFVGERWIAGRPGAGSGAHPNADELATLPAFELPDPRGRAVASGVWAGKLLVVHYWATWCQSCLDELPLLAGVQESLRGRGVQVVGIAIDRAADVQSFLALHPVGYQVLIGNPESVELARRLGDRTLGLPFTAIFDRQGRRVFDQTGPMTPAALRAQLDLLLGRDPDPGHPDAPEPPA